MGFLRSGAVFRTFLCSHISSRASGVSEMQSSSCWVLLTWACWQRAPSLPIRLQIFQHKHCAPRTSFQHQELLSGSEQVTWKLPAVLHFQSQTYLKPKGFPDTPYLSPPAIAWFSFLGAGVFFMYLFDVVAYLLWSQKPDIPSKSLDTHPLANDCRDCPRISSPSHFPMFLQEHSTTDGVPEMPLWSLSTQTPNSFNMVHVKPAQQHPNTRAVLQEACPTLPSSFSRVWFKARHIFILIRNKSFTVLKRFYPLGELY